VTHGDVVVEEKKDPEDESERKRERDPLPVEFPEANEPGTSMRGLKCSADGERQRERIVETAPIPHGRGRDEGERHAVVSTEATHVPVEKRRTGKKFEEERGDEHQEGENDRDERCTR
jgi:hypothetical protein